MQTFVVSSMFRQRLILILGSKQVDIAIPEVFVGGLLGSMLIFLFSAWACAAVGRTAQEVVNEVRRQFIERPGIMVSIVFHFEGFLVSCVSLSLLTSKNNLL